MNIFYCDRCNKKGERVSDWRYSPALISAMEFCGSCTKEIEIFIGWGKK